MRPQKEERSDRMEALDLFYRYRDDVYRLAVSYTRSPGGL
jgi:DNA-directed RNA polymerase specialized sigma24 family protein